MEIQGIDEYIEDNDDNKEDSNDTTKKEKPIGERIVSMKKLLHGEMKELANRLGLYKNGVKLNTMEKS